MGEVDYLAIAQSCLSFFGDSNVVVFVNPYHYQRNGSILELGTYSVSGIEKLAKDIEEVSKEIYEETKKYYITSVDWLDVFKR